MLRRNGKEVTGLWSQTAYVYIHQGLFSAVHSTKYHHVQNKSDKSASFKTLCERKWWKQCPAHCKSWANVLRMLQDAQTKGSNSNGCKGSTQFISWFSHREACLIASSLEVWSRWTGQGGQTLFYLLIFYLMWGFMKWGVRRHLGLKGGFGVKQMLAIEAWQRTKRGKAKELEVEMKQKGREYVQKPNLLMCPTPMKGMVPEHNLWVQQEGSNGGGRGKQAKEKSKCCQ
jgi:hypothetical protein